MCVSEGGHRCQTTHPATQQASGAHVLCHHQFLNFSIIGAHCDLLGKCPSSEAAANLLCGPPALPTVPLGPGCMPNWLLRRRPTRPAPTQSPRVSEHRLRAELGLRGAQQTIARDPKQPLGLGRR